MVHNIIAQEEGEADMKVIVVLLSIFLAVSSIFVREGPLAQETRASLTKAKEDFVGIIPKQYTLYKQCDEPWGNDKLGTGSLTICEAGCAMSSLSMILNTWKELLPKSVSVDPGTLNGWLINNKGYVSTDLLVWASADPLGVIKFDVYYTGAGSLSVADLQDAVNNNRPTVVNVRSGSHWVLVTGYEPGTDNFYVNDPGFSNTMYAYSCMSNYVMYHLLSTNSTTLF